MSNYLYSKNPNLNVNYLKLWQEIAKILFVYIQSIKIVCMKLISMFIDTYLGTNTPKRNSIVTFSILRKLSTYFQHVHCKKYL